jgi:Flp pilus assembly protein TadD
LTRQGKAAEALTEFTEAARLKPDFEQAHINLAVAYADAGRLQDALREFNEVLRINPGNEAARRAVQGILSQR